MYPLLTHGPPVPWSKRNQRLSSSASQNEFEKLKVRLAAVEELTQEQEAELENAQRATVMELEDLHATTAEELTNVHTT